jgi:hypothetical protein
VTLPADEHMDSSVTQFLVGYTVSPRFSLQLNVPFIIRYFRRIRDHQIQNGNQTGIGDLALTGNFLAYDRVTETSVFRFSLLGGVKFPSGNSAPLAEELPATVASVVARSRFPVARHGASLPEPHASDTALPEEGGLHGHDIALGSGSYDGIVGGQIFWTYRRFFVGGALQYAVRGLGSFEYQFANDLSYIGGPGYYVLLTHDYTLGAQLVLSGETKGNDTQAGVKANDTAMTSLYVGPGVSFTWGTSLAADVAIDVPVYQHETSLQLVPDVRVRGGLTWRF